MHLGTGEAEGPAFRDGRLRGLGSGDQHTGQSPGSQPPKQHDGTDMHSTAPDRKPLVEGKEISRKPNSRIVAESRRARLQGSCPMPPNPWTVAKPPKSGGNTLSRQGREGGRDWGLGLAEWNARRQCQDSGPPGPGTDQREECERALARQAGKTRLVS